MIWSYLRGQGITRALGGLIAMLAVCAGRAQAIEFVTDHSINSGQFAGEDIIVTNCTVSIDCTPGFTNYRSLLVRGYGVVRAGTGTLLLGVTGDTTIEAGSRLDASYSGYGHHEGPGAGGSNAGTGATHGGTGGGTSNKAYGLVTEPVTLGSGGGCNNNEQFKGGVGGGAAHIRVGGLFDLAGSVTAAGADGWKAGGGAGGSLWIEAGTLAGAGAIAANGGNAGTADSWPAHGGGGGRVAVHANSSIFSGSLQARGGSGSFSNGGPGSCYFRDAGTSTETLTFDNGGLVGPTRHQAPALTTTDLIVTAPTVMVFDCSSSAVQVRDLTVRSGATVTCPANDGSGLLIMVTRDLRVEAGGEVTATGAGHPYQQGLGRGHYNTGDGGTHGGTGSGNWEWWAYGSITEPVLPGSGGGSNNGNQFNGGAGGGRLSMDVTGTATVDGAVSADGGAAYKAGGGAGGSVWMHVGSLAGSGAIRADGGAASTEYWPAQGGGGGRVAVYWGSTAFSGSLSARGGRWTSNGVTASGGPGTVFTQNTTTLQQTVTFDNAGVAGTTYHAALSIAGADWFFSSATVVFRCVDEPLATRDLTVRAGGVVTCPGNDGIGLRVNVGRNLTVDLGGSIDVTGCGYVYEQGPGRGHSDTGDGGTHGGMGARNGWWWAYGSITDPTDQGSGGGSNNGGQFKGSAGGGILAITVLGDTTVNGAIAADGAGAWKAGGGSGGSIRLATGSLAGSGAIRANGGGAGTQDGWSASGGGGGRVSVTWDTSTFSGSFAARGGQGIAGGASIGGPGTVYTKDRLTPREAVTFDNGGLAGYTYHQAFAMPGADLIMASGEVYFGCTAGPLEVRDLTVLAGTVTCPGNDGAGLRLNVNRNLTVAPGGAVSVSGRGYPDRTGPGGGHYSVGDGGTYGGQGGRNWLAPYGSVHYPDSYGSGGGSNNGSQYTGGPGGGLMRLTVKGDLVVNGSVSADGYGAWEGGAGSGGALRIACGTISGTGVISAMGGTSSTADFSAGGGGGGRIAIRRSAGGAFNGGLVTVAGGSGARGGPAGGVGTIYWGHTYSEADLLLVSSDATLVWNADGTGLASVTLGNAGMAVVTGTQVGAYTGVPGAPGTVALGSTTVPSLQPNESVRVSVPVMSGVKVTNLHLVADPDNLVAEGSETNNTVILVVGRTDTSVYVPDRSGIITTTVALKGYLKRLTDNAWLSGKALTFKVAGTAVGTATTDAGGQAVLNWVIDAGAASRALRAEFAGDATYNPSGGNATLTAQTVSTKVYVVDRTAKIKSYVVLKAYLYLMNNATVAGKPMTMKLDGTELGTMDTNPSGYIQFGYTVAEGAGAGVRTIRTEFAGDAGYNASANTGKLTVTKANLYLWPYVRSGKTGTTLPLKAYVRSLPDYVVQPGKSVAFSVNGTAVDTGVVAADGWATVTWAIPAGEATGAHTATAAFAGDDWYLPASANAAFNVVP